MQDKHSDMVRTLVKPGVRIMETLTPAKVDLWHAITGIVGEVGELYDCISRFGTIDRENFIEEAGDIEFYLEQFRQRLGIRRKVSALESTVEPIDGLVIYAAELLDYVKKYVVYNKDVCRSAGCHNQLV